MADPEGEGTDPKGIENLGRIVALRLPRSKISPPMELLELAGSSSAFLDAVLDGEAVG
jgi:hypothetical protein